LAPSWPLIPEYQKVLEDSIADQAKGGQGNHFDHGVRCMPAGMPLMTIAFYPLEFVVTPDTTYVLIGEHDHYRRIFTDGRDWPESGEPTYAGYSIGRWIDEDGDGRFALSFLPDDGGHGGASPTFLVPEWCQFGTPAASTSPKRHHLRGRF
jgi:hypothetical protein